MDLYADNILDHYKHPHRKAVLAAPSIAHTEKNTTCGDALAIELMIEDDVITDIGWNGEGCAISQAAMSIISDELIGKKLTDIDALSSAEVLKLIGVPVGARRMKCALLCLHALKNAIHEYRKEPMQTWNDTVNLGRA